LLFGPHGKSFSNLFPWGLVRKCLVRTAPPNLRGSRCACGSRKVLLVGAARDAKEEPWLVVTIHHQGKPVSAGLREAYWRQWEHYHVLVFRVTIEEWKANAPPSARKARP
jgi:hypothetical protein